MGGDTFSGHATGGLGSVALASLLSRDRALLRRRIARGLAPEILPQSPLAARRAAFSAQGQTGADDFLLRGMQPSRYLGLQTGTDQAARHCHAGRRQAGDVSGSVGQPDQESLGVQTARPVGQVRFRSAAASGRAGRRNVLHPFDDVEDQHARSGREPHEHRLCRRRLSQRRRLGRVCPGQRVRQPAGVRGHSRSARRAAGRAQQLVERLSAGRVPGNRLQRRAADRQPVSRRRRDSPPPIAPIAIC